MPLTPHGKSKFKFDCGRSAGYESAEFVLPKSIVAENGGILQLEFETESGTIVQCADIIVQRSHPFVPQTCDPKCQNGGVCSNGVCRCGKMYEGEQCEIKCKCALLFDFCSGPVRFFDDNFIPFNHWTGRSRFIHLLEKNSDDQRELAVVQ